MFWIFLLFDSSSPGAQAPAKRNYFFVYMIYSTSNKNNGKATLKSICVSNPTTLSPFIRFRDRNMRKIMIPKDRLCSIPKIQNILVFIGRLSNFAPPGFMPAQGR